MDHSHSNHLVGKSPIPISILGWNRNVSIYLKLNSYSFLLKSNGHLKELEKSRKIKEDQGYQKKCLGKKNLEAKFLGLVKLVENSGATKKLMKDFGVLKLVEDFKSN